MKSSGFFPDKNDVLKLTMLLCQLDEDRRAQEKEDPNWWLYAEDGSEYDLDPVLFSSEKEYNKALEEAKRKYAWRETCEDGWEYLLDPQDYETEEEYLTSDRRPRYCCGW